MPKLTKLTKTSLAKFKLLTPFLASFSVGGQAVLEGVMMRTPAALAVAVRRPDGTIATKEQPWHSIAERFKWLKAPFLRGAVNMAEALVNGVQALNFSAEVALEEDDKAQNQAVSQAGWLNTLILVASFLVAMLFFVAVPHIASIFLLNYMGLNSGLDSFLFHFVDGLIKLGVFIGYILFISRLDEIKRVFEYHGAEHKSIFAYEKGYDLNVKNAQRFGTLHPRCGTAFIMVVMAVSILLFAVILPFFPVLGPKWLTTIMAIIIKLFLTIPIAGIAYEVIRWAGKEDRLNQKGIAHFMILPGLWMQRLTTKTPSDDQVQVALTALELALEREKQYGTDAKKSI